MREMGAICLHLETVHILGPKYVFNDCGPNRGFHSDFALPPF